MGKKKRAVRAFTQNISRALMWVGVPVLTDFAVFQDTSNGGRQFLSNRRSNRHIVPLYGKSDRLFTRVFRFEER